MTDKPKIGTASAGVPGDPLTYLDVAFSSAYTKRWHMVRTLRDQSLAEHAARVAYLFQHLLQMWLQDRGGALWADALQMSRAVESYGLRMALCHDLIETLTGDIPGHAKTPAIKAALYELENTAEACIQGRERFGVLTCPDHSDDHAEWVVAHHLVKLADIGEGYLFALGNQGRGYGTNDAKRAWVLDSLASSAQCYLDSLRAVSIEGVDGPVFSDEFCTDVAREFSRHFGIQPQHL